MTGSQVRVLFAAPVPDRFSAIDALAIPSSLTREEWSTWNHAALLLRLVVVVLFAVVLAFAFFAGLTAVSASTETCAMALNDEASTSRCAASQCWSALPSLHP